MAFDDIPEDRFDEHDECKRYAATLEAENAKLKDELAAAQEAHALDRAPMLRAMAVFDEGADDERWTPGVHVVDALIADHANLKAQADLDGSHIADLTADNAKLRDLLRWICTHPEVHLTKGMWSEIKSAIEPSGNPGELGEV